MYVYPMQHFWMWFCQYNDQEHVCECVSVWVCVCVYVWVCEGLQSYWLSAHYSYPMLALSLQPRSTCDSLSWHCTKVSQNFAWPGNNIEHFHYRNIGFLDYGKLCLHWKHCLLIFPMNTTLHSGSRCWHGWQEEEQVKPLWFTLFIFVLQCIYNLL